MMTNEEIQDLLRPLRESQPTTVRKVRFSEFAPPEASLRVKTSLGYLDDVPVEITAEIGGAVLKVREILGLQNGSVIELDRVAGDAIDLLVNEQRFGRGEILVISDRFVIRVCEIQRPHHGVRSKP